MKTAGDLAALAIEEDAALSACEIKRGALVGLADLHNAAVAPVAKH